jgi:hypothetical protein
LNGTVPQGQPVPGPALAASAWMGCAQRRSDSVASSVDAATADESAVEVGRFALLETADAQSGHHPRVLGWWGVVGRLMI